MQLADEKGSLTGDEIADVLTTDELQVSYQSEWTIGREQTREKPRKINPVTCASFTR